MCANVNYKFGDLGVNTDWWTFNLMKSANIQGKGARDLTIILLNLHLALDSRRIMQQRLSENNKSEMKSVLVANVSALVPKVRYWMRRIYLIVIVILTGYISDCCHGCLVNRYLYGLVSYNYIDSLLLMPDRHMQPRLSV